GGFGGDDEEGGLADMAGGVLMLFLAPMAALIVQMAISRTREFGADAGGAEILGDPLPLASALEKLEGWKHNADPREMQAAPAAAHLYITPPTLGGLMALFSTHPPTEKRIAKLREIKVERSPVV
ncbi:MAG: M48 family metalloprotease, partial [Chloroflexota bacterium]